MNYKETTVSGEVYHRFGYITISNPKGGTATVSCLEQQATTFNGVTQVIPIGNLDFVFDPNESVAVLDPVTNVPTGGTVSGAQVYAMIYSFIIAEAQKRDAKVAYDLANPNTTP
jgi:hypothetical protein